MKSRRNANNAWQRTVTLDFNAGGTDLTFVEPSGLDPAIFNTGLEQFLPKQAPPQYTPMSTSGFGTTVNPTWLNTILSVGWNGFKGYGQGQLNIYNCATDMVIGTVNFAVLGTYNGTSWVVNQFGGDNPYIWIPSPDWSRNLLYKESGDPGAWNDMHGWSKFSGNIGITAGTMGAGLSGTALGETAVSQLPRAARDGVVKTWSSLVRRNNGSIRPTNRFDLHADLRSKGFEFKSTSEGGYVTYKHPDGTTVTIKPSGEVIATRPKVSLEGKKYSERLDYDFNRLPDQSHSTGHFVEPLQIKPNLQ